MFFISCLRYLHEGCQPPVIHRSFDSEKILLDDALAVRVSECGLASLMLSDSVGQVNNLAFFSTIVINLCYVSFNELK